MYEKTVTILIITNQPRQEMRTGILMFYPASTSLLTREQSLKSTGQTQQTTHSYTSIILSRTAI